MKNEALYNKTVDILVQAYFNDTLEHGNCYACAVGNIIAGNCGYKFLTTGDWEPRNVWVGRGTKYWDKNNNFNLNPVKLLGDAIGVKSFENSDQVQHVLSTGYSLPDLYLIENAFEKAPIKDDRMFSGLMAVIDVLDKIHENNSSEVTLSTKSKFHKQLA